MLAETRSMQPLLKSYFAVIVFGLAGTHSSFGASILLSESSGNVGFGYGFSSWSNFSTELDYASGFGVTVVPSFENLTQMLESDALFLDQRWTSGSLSATELSNLATFISTGKRVVMVGENNFWTTWNNQILGLVGSSHAGEYNGTTTPVFSHELTAGVTSVSVGTAGLASISDGTALFDQNWATLWGSNQNVLTILDVNALDDTRWAGNGTFARNVASWLSSPSTPSTSVPDEGRTVALLGLVVVVLGALRRFTFSS
jgi:hypothetical protein